MSSKPSAAVAPRRTEDGATAVEYGIMVMLIAVTIITVVAFLGGQTKSDFECLEATMSDPVDPCGG